MPLPKKLTIEQLFSGIESLEFPCEVGVYRTDGNTVSIQSEADYRPGERDSGLKEAWDDFKAVSKVLSDHRVKLNYDDNRTPEWDDPSWEIVVRLRPINQYLYLQP